MSFSNRNINIFRDEDDGGWTFVADTAIEITEDEADEFPHVERHGDEIIGHQIAGAKFHSLPELMVWMISTQEEIWRWITAETQRPPHELTVVRKGMY